jgi:hypothetical protein
MIERRLIDYVQPANDPTSQHHGEYWRRNVYGSL